MPGLASHRGSGDRRSPATRTPRRSARGWVAAVLDLPRVVQRVPCDAARSIPLRPALLHWGVAIRGSLQGVGDGAPKCCDRSTVVPIRHLEAKAELSDVGALGITHVIGHFVPVAATAARA